MSDPPPGDDVEHSEETGLAVDGNPSGTPWETETYPSQTFGAKKGVGLYVDAGKEVRPSAVEVRTSHPGWDVEVRSGAGANPPTDLNGWKIVGGTSDIGKKTRIPISVPGQARFYMLWDHRCLCGGH